MKSSLLSTPAPIALLETDEDAARVSWPPSLVGAGPLDTTPRALWRVLQLGEATRIISPHDQDVVLAAFAADDTDVARELADIGCSRLDLLVLVSLLAVGPSAVSVVALQRETLAEWHALAVSLAGLVRRGAAKPGPDGFTSTAAGRQLALRGVFRAVNAAVHGSSAPSNELRYEN